MSDETTRPEDWGAPNPASVDPGTAGATNPGPEDRVGFCQDCGKPLTQATIRNVGTGVFCEPCLTARIGAVPTPGYTAVPPYAVTQPIPGEPSPVLAAILGFIPGVGAIYNGQYAKGIAHVAIFAILVSLSDNVNGIFGLFVAGWESYMAFEAYHTAKARLEGLPLPNAFGLNDIGERLGFGKSWGTAANGKAGGPGTSAPPTATPGYTAAPGYAPVTPIPAVPATDWVGYVPPTAFGAPAVPQDPYAARLHEQALRDAGFYNPLPYAQTYTGSEHAVPPIAVVPPPEAPGRHVPTGAFWLIGLGVLILLANLLPDWKDSERWWCPVLFAGLSVWTLTRRLRSGAKLICILRWPVILMVLAILFTLHALNFGITFGLACAVLLIVFGGLLFLERTAGAAPAYAAPATYTGSVVPSIVPAYTPAEEAPRAAWTSTTDEAHKPETDRTQEDQR